MLVSSPPAPPPAADLIGFHTFDYARHFLSCCSRLLGLEHKTSRGSIIIEYYGRDVGIKIMPTGEGAADCAFAAMCVVQQHRSVDSMAGMLAPQSCRRVRGQSATTLCHLVAVCTRGDNLICQRSVRVCLPMPGSHCAGFPALNESCGRHALSLRLLPACLPLPPGVNPERLLSGFSWSDTIWRQVRCTAEPRILPCAPQPRSSSLWRRGRRQQHASGSTCSPSPQPIFGAPPCSLPTTQGELAAQFAGKTVLLGVDDMDVFKGIELKLQVGGAFTAMHRLYSMYLLFWG